MNAVVPDLSDDPFVAEQQRALVALQHRTRNAMATVRALVRHGADTRQDAAEFAAHLDGRLGAVTRAQAVLARCADRAVDLRGLILDELSAASAREGERLVLTGSDLSVAPASVQPLVLAFHELATNAIKFGALAGSEGRVAIGWRDDAGAARREVELVWEETVPPPLPDAGEPGFGFDFLTNGLAYELDARTTLDVTATGLCCVIVFPA